MSDSLFGREVEQFAVPIPFQEAIESLHKAVLAVGIGLGDVLHVGADQDCPLTASAGRNASVFGVDSRSESITATPRTDRRSEGRVKALRSASRVFLNRPQTRPALVCRQQPLQRLNERRLRKNQTPASP